MIRFYRTEDGGGAAGCSEDEIVEILKEPIEIETLETEPRIKIETLETEPKIENRTEDRIENRIENRDRYLF
jgi:uncharacterized membrane protein